MQILITVLAYIGGVILFAFLFSYVFCDVFFKKLKKFINDNCLIYAKSDKSNKYKYMVVDKSFFDDEMSRKE